MVRRLSFAICGLVAGCSCRSGLPDDPIDDPPRHDSEAPEPDTADTSAPPCDHPETEPNNDGAHAEQLGTDVRGCGDFVSEDDVDVWDFALGEEAWLAVDVAGWSLGSEARLALTLASDDLGEALTLTNAGDLPEVHLAFPAPPSSWRGTVRQSLGRDRGAGPDWFYEILASSSKPPVTWDLDEASNERAAPQRLADADADDLAVAVLGTLTTPDDEDWYDVTFPGAGYVLAFDVDAAPYGSAGNFSLRVVDETGAEVIVKGDEEAAGIDPRVVRETTGPGAVTVQVLEADGGAGRPYWYRLGLTVEVP